VPSLLQKCEIYAFQSDKIRCDSVAKIALETAEKNNDDVGVFFAYTFLSTGANNLSFNQKSLNAYLDF